jgi:capsular polysaccharide biosynthesis protein
VNLTDAGRRVLLHHWLLIVFLTLVGGNAFFFIAESRPSEFSASARFALGPADPRTPESVAGLADSADAIVTSPGLVRQVLEDLGIRRDPLVFAREHVNVATLGTSGVLELRVSDRDPSVAASIANTLMDRLIVQWQEASGGQISDVLVTLSDEIDQLNVELATLEGRLASLNLLIARNVNPELEQRYLARRDSISEQRDARVQQRLIMQANLSDLVLQEAGQTPPRVIDRAAVPITPDANNAATSAALGALLGLLIGIGIAAAIEAFSPTLVGAEAIADALRAPLLGTLSGNTDRGSAEMSSLAYRVRLAAAGSEAGEVEFVSVGLENDPSWLPSAVQAADLAGAAPSEGNGRSRIVLRSFGGNGDGNGSNGNGRVRALVVVTPATVKRSDLRTVRDLQSVTAWPLLGVVTVRRRFTRSRPVPPQPGPPEVA